MLSATQTRLVRMQFWARDGNPHLVHIGGDRKGLEHVSPVIHSDTLFSALCHAWVDCYGAADLKTTLLDHMQEDTADPPLRLSSAFLYVWSGTQRFFLPKPLLPLPGQESSAADVQEVYSKYAQRLKEIAYVPLSTDLWRWLSGEEWTDSDAYERYYTQLLEAHSVWSTLWLPHWLQANTVSRDWGHTNTFARGIAHLSENAGYYFLLVYSAAAIVAGLPERLDDVLETLSELGIGGERSLGLGQWQYSPQEELSRVWNPLVQGTPRRGVCYLLSLYAPTEIELRQLGALRATRSAYHLVPRKGWFDSPTGFQMKRKSCRMFREGSILYLPESPLPRGILVDVSPAAWNALDASLGQQWHPIYRNGLALAVQL